MGEDPREQRAKCHQFLMKFLRLQSTIQRAKLPLVKLIAEEEKKEGEGKEKEEGEEEKKKEEKEEEKKEKKEEEDDVRRISLRKLKL